jgi:hypothetical protein
LRAPVGYTTNNVSHTDVIEPVDQRKSQRLLMRAKEKERKDEKKEKMIF